MDHSQEQALLKAIAVSSLHLPQISQADRQSAFSLLEEFKRYDGRLSQCVAWLHSDRHDFQNNDITVATKLLALEVILNFLEKGYSALSEPDRVALRQSVLRSAHVCAAAPMDDGSRILARKIADVLEGLVIRDFPQRWTNFSTQVFAPRAQGGLWYSERGPNSGFDAGVKICLECLKLIAEDCTDSDFNSKISTSRRNDVLIGLNEVHNDFLPNIYDVLGHYPLLQESRSERLYPFYCTLIHSGRNTSCLTPEEAAEYRREVSQKEKLATMIHDALVTLEKFCWSMPSTWITGGTPDFLPALLHLLREPEGKIQIRAASCLENLLLRGKLEFQQWISLIGDLPRALDEASQYITALQQFDSAENAAALHTDSSSDPLTKQLEFHHTLSRMLSTVVSSHMAHVSSTKSILERKGAASDKFNVFLRYLVELLHHPSGRICSEQINMWVGLLRDPQVAKAHVLRPFSEEILTCYMDKLVRIRWSDVESGDHPHSAMLEASFDDEDEYDSWMADLRSRSSLLFKFIGNSEPAIAASVLSNRVRSKIAQHGNGEPISCLEPSNNQLTESSEAVLQFEGLYQPMENTLSGLPTWAISANVTSGADTEKESVRYNNRAALTDMCRALVEWEPRYLWLKFRRAALLDALKHYWDHEPSTLLQAVDSLLKYLGLPDEWNPNSTPSAGGSADELSSEVVGLKKKSGVALVSISRKVPQHLVPWLSQLSAATQALLKSEGLIPMNQMHLYEYLSCVATAVDDTQARSNFISEVLSDAIAVLDSESIQQLIANSHALLRGLGVIGAAEQPSSVSDITNVKGTTATYTNLFGSLNRLLSVGRRCNEASRKRASQLEQTNTFGSIELNQIPDEGPVSIQELAVVDPFVPLWPRILPSLLTLLDSILGIWRPEHQAVLLLNPYQRYVYAISDDEAYLSKTHDSKSGGVFGEGGTAGSVVAGISRRDANLVPKWSGWLSELRNTCFQMLGLLAAQRALFSPEVSVMYPRLVAVISNGANLKAMEHRHMIQFLKHVIEIGLHSCPSTLYQTHLEPLVGPVFENMRFRLEKTWAPVIGVSADGSSAVPGNSALTSAGCANAARLAMDTEVWFPWYYAHAGLFVGDLDSVTAEAATEKQRVELGRVFSDVVQAALALRGDWALVIANQAKEEQAQKRHDPSKLSSGPSTRLNDEGVALNAEGTRKKPNQAVEDARKMLRIHRMCHFLLLQSQTIAGNLTLTIIQCLSYPDAYTCRRITKICHRILETVAWVPAYSQLLGQQMFTELVKNIVTEPKWMVGMEWDVINVARDIYCRLVLGQTLLAGGQGAAQQQPANVRDSIEYEQAKAVQQPLQGGGILTTPSQLPRQVLAGLPGILHNDIEAFEESMKRKRSAKDQKDIIRDLLRVAADKLKEMNPRQSPGNAAAGIFDRAIEEESLLHSKNQKKMIPALPEVLVTRSQMEKKAKRASNAEPEGLSAFQL